MKMITAIIRPERLPDVKTSLFREGFTGMSLSTVLGHGGEQDTVEHYRGLSLIHIFPRASAATRWQRLCLCASTYGSKKHWEENRIDANDLIAKVLLLACQIADLSFLRAFCCDVFPRLTTELLDNSETGELQMYL